MKNYEVYFSYLKPCMYTEDYTVEEDSDVFHTQDAETAEMFCTHSYGHYYGFSIKNTICLDD